MIEEYKTWPCPRCGKPWQGGWFSATVDPDLPRAPETLGLIKRKNDRLQQLRKRLFPDADTETEEEEPS
jgi:hypothetical protein